MVMSDNSAIRGGMPERAGAVMLPRQLTLPAKLRKLYVAGCQATAAGHVQNVNEVDGVPPNEVVARDQAEARRKALVSTVPPARTDILERGLNGLDRADQHPDEILAWLMDPEARTLILAGPPGNGKTEAGYAAQVHAATEGAAMPTRHGGSKVRPLLVRAIDVNTYIAALRPDGSSDPVWRLRDRVYSCELLLGDDLGAELDSAEMTSFMRDELARLMTWRLEHNLRTIWTTNRRGDDLQLMVGSRMWSRLNERAERIVFTGRDRRKLTPLEW
jgi:hypothetical protein